MKPTRSAALAALLALTLAPAAPARAASLWISEVFYDAVGSDDGLGFVELWGAPGLPLDGWVIEGVNGADGAVGPSLPLSGSVGADGLFVLADSLSGSSSVPDFDQLANFDLQNADQRLASTCTTRRSRGIDPTTPATVGPVQGCWCVASVSPLGCHLADPR
jgi:hypothetical protein